MFVSDCAVVCQTYQNKAHAFFNRVCSYVGDMLYAQLIRQTVSAFVGVCTLNAN